MTLVQSDARQFFCYLFLSYKSLVLVGVGALSPISLTGALCVWMAVSISLGGFGLTIRALEARRGRLKLNTFQGLYDNTPALAGLFLVTGLASVGFPGTFGYVGTEMLVDGTVKAFPHIGPVILITSALNGIAVVHAYFRLFTGTHHRSHVSLAIGAREGFAVVTLSALIFIGGLFPQFNVASRERAVTKILRERETNRETRHVTAATTR
jgi:NADH-quinone oxidoreductase subunit M